MGPVGDFLDFWANFKGAGTVCSKEGCFDVKIPCDGIKLTGRNFRLRNYDVVSPKVLGT